MKLKNLLVAILTLFVVVSCKKESNQLETNSQTTNNNSFVFTVEFTANKTDTFSLFYTEDGSINFGEKVIWKQIQGSDNMQKVEFTLPKDVYPTQFRLDLGNSQEQETVTIKSIEFKFNNKNRLIKGEELGAFFRADGAKCTFDHMSGIVKTNVKDGKKQGFSLYPNESIQAIELPKLLK